MSSAGFQQYKLTDVEQLLLAAFDHYGELLHPTAALSGLASSGEVHSALKHLCQKQLVVNDRPLRLTRAGRYLHKKLKSNERTLHTTRQTSN